MCTCYKVNGLYYLTGGSTIDLDITPKEILSIKTGFKENSIYQSFYDFTKKIIQSGSIITGSNILTEETKGITKKGIAPGHGYTVIDTVTVNDINGNEIQLFKVKNPNAYHMNAKSMTHTV